MKHAQLTGLIELGILALGEVETPVHLLHCKQHSGSCEGVIMGGVSTVTVTHKEVSQKCKKELGQEKTVDTIYGSSEEVLLSRAFGNCDDGAKINPQFCWPISKQ